MLFIKVTHTHTHQRTEGVTPPGEADGSTPRFKNVIITISEVPHFNTSFQLFTNWDLQNNTLKIYSSASEFICWHVDQAVYIGRLIPHKNNHSLHPRS